MCSAERRARAHDWTASRVRPRPRRRRWPWAGRPGGRGCRKRWGSRPALAVDERTACPAGWGPGATWGGRGNGPSAARERPSVHRRVEGQRVWQLAGRGRSIGVASCPLPARNDTVGFLPARLPLYGVEHGGAPLAGAGAESVLARRPWVAGPPPQYCAGYTADVPPWGWLTATPPGAVGKALPASLAAQRAHSGADEGFRLGREVPPPGGAAPRAGPVPRGLG